MFCIYYFIEQIKKRLLDSKGENKNVYKLCKKFYKIYLEKAQSKLDGEIKSIKTKITNLKDVI
jgi:predicted transcriptional regulator